MLKHLIQLQCVPNPSKTHCPPKPHNAQQKPASPAPPIPDSIPMHTAHQNPHRPPNPHSTLPSPPSPAFRGLRASAGFRVVFTVATAFNSTHSIPMRAQPLQNSYRPPKPKPTPPTKPHTAAALPTNPHPTHHPAQPAQPCLDRLACWRLSNGCMDAELCHFRFPKGVLGSVQMVWSCQPAMIQSPARCSRDTSQSAPLRLSLPCRSGTAFSLTKRVFEALRQRLPTSVVRLSLGTT